MTKGHLHKYVLIELILGFSHVDSFHVSHERVSEIFADPSRMKASGRAGEGIYLSRDFAEVQKNWEVVIKVLAYVGKVGAQGGDDHADSIMLYNKVNLLERYCSRARHF